MRVEALRSKEEIQEFKTLLVEMNNGNTLYRDLFVFLSHTGYRIIRMPCRLSTHISTVMSWKLGNKRPAKSAVLNYTLLF